MRNIAQGVVAGPSRLVPGKAARRQRGTGLVEQAFILVILLTMLFGIVDFGRALYTYHFVANAAREATRWASVRGTLCNHALTGCQANTGNVDAYVKNVTGMGLDPAKITVTPSWGPPPNNSPACVTPYNMPTCIVTVSVQYDYTFFFPFLPTAPVRMTSTSKMVITQ
jgi:Flp pilus assembly protein TadG